MATRKLDSYDQFRRLLALGPQAEHVRTVLTKAGCYGLLRQTMREPELGWAQTGLGEYQPVNVEMHVYVGVEETELNERIEALERTIEGLVEQQRVLRATLDHLLTVPQPSYVGLSREQRLQAARMRVARQVELARSIGKSPAELVEELTSLFPMSEEGAERLMRED